MGILLETASKNLKTGLDVMKTDPKDKTEDNMTPETGDLMDLFASIVAKLAIWLRTVPHVLRLSIKKEGRNATSAGKRDTLRVIALFREKKKEK